MADRREGAMPEGGERRLVLLLELEPGLSDAAARALADAVREVRPGVARVTILDSTTSVRAFLRALLREGEADHG